MTLSLSNYPSHAKLPGRDPGDNDLQRHQHRRQAHARLALLAQGPEVGAGIHGHVAPLAAPALQGLGRVGGVDRVEEGDGDERRNEGRKRGCQEKGGVVGGFALGLASRCALVFCSLSLG